MEQTRTDLILQWRCNTHGAIICEDQACEHETCDGKLILLQDCEKAFSDHVLSLITKLMSIITNIKGTSKEGITILDDKKATIERESNDLLKDMLNLLDSKSPTKFRALRSSVEELDNCNRKFIEINRRLKSMLSEPKCLSEKSPPPVIDLMKEKEVFEIMSLAISKDSKFIAYGLVNGCIIIKETNLLQTLCKFIGHILGVNSLIWSPDSQSLYSSSLDNTIKIWNHRILQDSTILKEDQGSIKLLSLTSDERALIYSYEEGSKICIKLCRIDGTATSQIELIHFPFLSNGSLFVWEFPQNIICTNLQMIPDFYFFVAISYLPQQGLVALGSEDGFIYIYDVESLLEKHKLQGHGSTITCISASDSLMASYSTNSVIIVWSIENWQQLALIQDIEIVCLCIALNNKFIAIANNKGQIKSIII